MEDCTVNIIHHTSLNQIQKKCRNKPCKSYFIAISRHKKKHSNTSTCVLDESSVDLKDLTVGWMKAPLI